MNTATHARICNLQPMDLHFAKGSIPLDIIEVCVREVAWKKIMDDSMQLGYHGCLVVFSSNAMKVCWMHGFEPRMGFSTPSEWGKLRELPTCSADLLKLARQAMCRSFETLDDMEAMNAELDEPWIITLQAISPYFTATDEEMRSMMEDPLLRKWMLCQPLMVLHVDVHPEDVPDVYIEQSRRWVWMDGVRTHFSTSTVARGHTGEEVEFPHARQSKEEQEARGCDLTLLASGTEFIDAILARAPLEKLVRTDRTEAKSTEASE